MRVGLTQITIPGFMISFYLMMFGLPLAIILMALVLANSVKPGNRNHG